MTDPTIPPIEPMIILRPTDDHFLALGRYISKWGEIEGILNKIVGDIIIAGGGGDDARPYTALTAFVARLPVAMKIDAAVEILDDPLNGAQIFADSAPTLKRYLRACYSASRPRNKIVHGQWVSENSKHVVRMAAALTFDEAKAALPGTPWFTQKASARNRFTLARLAQETERLVTLVDIGSNLVIKCSHRRLRESWARISP